MFEEVLKICENGDYDGLEQILKTYDVENEEDEKQLELTFAAAENGHTKVLDLLLLNECLCDGEALSVAFFHDHLKCFELIIEQYKFEFSEEVLRDIEYRLKDLPEKRREKYFYLLIHKNKVLPRNILRYRNWKLLKKYDYCFTEDDVDYLNQLRLDCLENPERLKYFYGLDQTYVQVSKFFDIQQEAINTCGEGNLQGFRFLEEKFSLHFIVEYLEAACRSRNFELIDYLTSSGRFKFKVKNICISNEEIKSYLKKKKKELFCPDTSESESD